jgi:hypothetical protein
VGAGGLEPSGGGLHGGGDLGLHRQAAAGIQQQADAQALQVLGRRGRHAGQSSACAGRLMLSRASGWLSTCIISAASLTLRVMGPAARPV